MVQKHFNLPAFMDENLSTIVSRTVREVEKKSARFTNPENLHKNHYTYSSIYFSYL